MKSHLVLVTYIAAMKADLTVILDQTTLPQTLLPRFFSKTEKITIFDIGACEGDDTIRYSKLFPNSKIFSVEALPANQEIIRGNLIRYDVANAVLVPSAFGNKEEVIQFHVSSGEPDEKLLGSEWNYGNKSNSILPPKGDKPMFGWLEFKDVINVNATTLDQYCRSNDIREIHFVHMDVQGAESLVLEGGENMLKNTFSIWLEVANEELYKGQVLRGGIEKRMRELGFALIAQEQRGSEGDQFYLNKRFIKTWKYVIRERIRSKLF